MSLRTIIVQRSLLSPSPRWLLHGSTWDELTPSQVPRGLRRRFERLAAAGVQSGEALTNLYVYRWRVEPQRAEEEVSRQKAPSGE